MFTRVGMGYMAEVCEFVMKQGARGQVICSSRQFSLLYNVLCSGKNQAKVDGSMVDEP